MWYPLILSEYFTIIHSTTEDASVQPFFISLYQNLLSRSACPSHARHGWQLRGGLWQQCRRRRAFWWERRSTERERQRLEKGKSVSSHRVARCDCCSTLCWKRLTGVVLTTNALSVWPHPGSPRFDVQADAEEFEKAVALPGPSLTKPLHVQHNSKSMCLS